MKKFWFYLVVVAAVILSATGLSSCGEDEPESKYAYFTLGVSSLYISGGDLAEVRDYMSDVEFTYYRVLGMTNGSNSITFNEDYAKKSAEMKSKFNSTLLPEPPVTSAEYEFTYVLYGTGSTKVTDLKDMEVVASKTFSNK